MPPPEPLVIDEYEQLPLLKGSALLSSWGQATPSSSEASDAEPHHYWRRGRRSPRRLGRFTLPAVRATLSGAAKVSVSLAYMLAMGVCGITLVALGTTIGMLAENVGERRVERLGEAFLLRGVGAACGSAAAGVLYRHLPGNAVLSASLAILGCALVALPLTESRVALRWLFLVVGLGSAVTDTGCQAMTVVLHGREGAGPWLGANAVVFSFAGAAVPLIHAMTADLAESYSVLATVAAAVVLVLFLVPTPTGPGAPPTPNASSVEAATWGRGRNHGGDAHDKPAAAPSSGADAAGGGGAAAAAAADRLARGRHLARGAPVLPDLGWRVEGALCAVIFCIGGAQVAATAYLTAFVGARAHVESAAEASAVVAVLWLFIAAGQVLGLWHQRVATAGGLARVLANSLAVATVAAATLLLDPTDAALSWVAVAVWGMCSGPALALCYSLHHRARAPTVEATVALMAAHNLGASVVPFAAAALWVRVGPGALPLVMLLGVAVPAAVARGVEAAFFRALVDEY